MPITQKQREEIIKYVKEGKKYSDIADMYGIRRQAMGSYIRDMKHLLYDKCDSKYFNIDLYTKELSTI
jgi:hypothetical protein